MQQELLKDCIEGVVLFNTYAGNYDNITDEYLLSQARVVREESCELLDAVANNEGKEQVLKECVDVLVTITGFATMLQRAGYDVLGAWKATNDNNLTKYPTSYTDACYTLTGYEATEVSVAGFQMIQVDSCRWAIKDGNGKIRKPIGYEKVSVKQFIPN
jgi:NTP pyrophosphatase (non-canonical NTP hydrolase)